VARARAEPPFPYLRWLGSQRQAGRLWTGRLAFYLGARARLAALRVGRSSHHS